MVNDLGAAEAPRPRRCADGDPRRRGAGNALAVLKATMAIPVAYGKVVHVNGVPYIDGGVADAESPFAMH